MTKRPDRAIEVGDRPALEITPAMIAAGVAEFRSRSYGEPIEAILPDVFLAMCLEAGSGLLRPSD